MTQNGTHKGRYAAAYPSYTTSTGYTIQVRRVSPDSAARLRAAAERELADEKPAVPTERVRMAGPELGGQPIEQDIPRPDAPEYRKALAAWQKQVEQLNGRKFRDFIANYAVVTETDEGAVRELREAHAALGDDSLRTDSDRNIWMWMIVAISKEDVRGLFNFAIGMSVPTKEAIQAEKDVFPGNVPEEKHLDAGNRSG